MESQTGERGATEDALFHWWRDRLTEFSATWFGPRQSVLFAEIERELPLLHALLADARRCTVATRDIELLRVVAGLWPYWSASGRGEEAVELLDELRDRVRGTDTPSADARFEGDWALAWFALSDADVPRTSDAIDDAFAVVGDRATPAQQARLEQLRGMREIYSSDAVASRAHLENALGFHQVGGTDDALFIDLSFLGAAASMLGDQEASFDYGERAMVLCDGRGERWLRTYAVWAFALSAWRVGDPHRAFALAADGLTLSAELDSLYTGVVCLDVMGWYEAEFGHASEGARLLGISERVRADLDTDFWDLADIRHSALAVGRRRAGAGVFERAFREGFAAQDVDERSWTTATSLGTSPTRTQTLTPRQREIAALIAEGRSNKEIARMLFVAVRTVETHIENIFTALDVSSRAQVAAWSVRQA